MAEDHREISMNNNERIASLETTVRSMQKQVDDLHRQFLEKTPTGEPPLAERMSAAVVAFERASWLGKFGVWCILGLGSMAAAGSGIISFLQKVGK